jgi:hypothetical protein
MVPSITFETLRPESPSLSHIVIAGQQSLTIFERHLGQCYQGGCGEPYRAYSICPEIVVLISENCGRLRKLQGS